MLALAIALITTSPEVPDPLPHPDDWEALSAALIAKSVELDLVDKGEIWHPFTDKDNWEFDLNGVRRRYQELKDAPPLSDAKWWPSQKELHGPRSFNLTYQFNLRQIRPTLSPYMEPVWVETMAETKALYALWDACDDAKIEHYSPRYRRLALKKLKDALSTEDYYAGRLPFYVPIHRFVSE